MKNSASNGRFDVLSPLEADVLEVLWHSSELRVREIYRLLRQRGRKVALTSVAVILDRLFESGIVGRKIESARGGLRYVYSPKKDKRQFETSVVEGAVNRLIDKFGNVAISYFNERFVNQKGGKKGKH